MIKLLHNVELGMKHWLIIYQSIIHIHILSCNHSFYNAILCRDLNNKLQFNRTIKGLHVSAADNEAWDMQYASAHAFFAQNSH